MRPREFRKYEKDDAGGAVKEAGNSTSERGDSVAPGISPVDLPGRAPGTETAGGWGAAERLWVGALCVGTLGLVLLVQQWALRDFPNSGDEYSYLLSARLFAEGRLSVPSPEPREAFTLFHVVNNGRYFGKYPPGWPGLLAVGVAIGIPWIVNPLLGVATVFLIYRVGREHFSPRTGLIAAFLAACSPFVVLNSASYFSHVSCLFFLTGLTGAVLRCMDAPDRARGAWWCAGACAGAAFLIRPFTAAAVGVPLVAALAMHLRRDRLRWRAAALGAFCALVPFLVAVALWILYNWAQTGNPWLQPFALYEGQGVPGWTEMDHDWSWALRHNVAHRLIDLNRWLPMSVVFLASIPFWRDLRQDPKVTVLGAVVLCLLAGYIPFLRDPGNEYGPRYIYESSFAVVLLVAAVIVRMGRVGAIATAIILVLNGLYLARNVKWYAQVVRERMTVYDSVRRAGISNAIVILKGPSGTMAPADLTRNGIRFDGPVLYVLDRGARNIELSRQFPNRELYEYRYDESSKTGRVLPVARGN